MRVFFLMNTFEAKKTFSLINDFILSVILELFISGIFFAVIIYKETNCQFCSIMKRKKE